MPLDSQITDRGLRMCMAETVHKPFRTLLSLKLQPEHPLAQLLDLVPGTLTRAHLRPTFGLESLALRPQHPWAQLLPAL